MLEMEEVPPQLEQEAAGIGCLSGELDCSSGVWRSSLAPQCSHPQVLGLMGQGHWRGQVLCCWMEQGQGPVSMQVEQSQRSLGGLG